MSIPYDIQKHLSHDFKWFYILPWLHLTWQQTHLIRCISDFRFVILIPNTQI